MAKKKGETIKGADIEEFKAALESSDAPSISEPLDSPKKVSARGTKIRVNDVRAKKKTLPPEPTDGIGQVFEELADSQSKMEKLDRSTARNFPWGIVVTILMVLAGLAVAGFFVFNRNQRFTGQNIQVKISAPKTVASGDDVTLTIQLANQEAVDLVRGEVNVEYPDGFTYSSSSMAASNTYHNSFPIGRLQSGRTEELVIRGTLVGSLQESKDFSALLSYRPATFNSDFQVRTKSSIVIDSSRLELSWSGPPKIVSGAAGTWTLLYHNTSQENLRNIQVEIALPEGFAITNTTPKPAEGPATWRYPSLAKDGQGQVAITGIMTGTPGDSQELKATVSLSNTTGAASLQAQDSIVVALVNTGLVTTVAVNGSTEAETIQPGETLNYTIRLANKSDSEVPDITVEDQVRGRVVQWSDLKNPLKAVVKNGSLTWTKKEVPALTSLAPGQEVSLTFSLSASANIKVTVDADQDPAINSSIFVRSSILPQANPEKPAATTTTKVGTVLKLQAEGRYYNDDQSIIGSGPVPPVVGQTTSYRIRWILTNTTSQAKTVKVTTTLPAHVFWTGQKTARDSGEVAFDPTSRAVTWSMNTLPAGSGSRFPTVAAEFEVSITPTTEQAGSVVVLTDTTTASGADAFTNAVLTATQPQITTDVPTDPRASGEGKVRSSP